MISIISAILKSTVFEVFDFFECAEAAQLKNVSRGIEHFSLCAYKLFKTSIKELVKLVS